MDITVCSVCDFTDIMTLKGKCLDPGSIPWRGDLLLLMLSWFMSTQWRELKEGQVLRLTTSRRRLSSAGSPFKELVLCFFGFSLLFSLLYSFFFLYSMHLRSTKPQSEYACIPYQRHPLYPTEITPAIFGQNSDLGFDCAVSFFFFLSVLWWVYWCA